MKSLLSAIAVVALAAINAGAQSIGVQNIFPFEELPLPGQTTNSFTPNTANAVFIGTPDVDYIGLQLSSITGTNPTAPAVPENIVLTYAKSSNGQWPDSQSISNITLHTATSTASTNLAGVSNPDSAATYIDVHGMQGIYILSLISTNAPSAATNFVSLSATAKAAKAQAIPSTVEN